jgi:hypothetical protein
MNEIQKLPSVVIPDAKEYHIEEVKAAEIQAVFTPMLDKMTALEKKANEIFAMEESPETSAKARELRLIYMNVRGATKKAHANMKAFYLAGGKFVDAFKNTQLFAAEGIEKRLMEIEKAEEIKVQKLKDELQEERISKLKMLGIEVFPSNLGEMQDFVWDAYFVGLKAEIKQKAAEDRKKAKLAKEAKEKADLEAKRKFKTSRLINYIPGYDETVWSALTVAQFDHIVEKAIAARTAEEDKQKAIDAELESTKRFNEKLQAKLDKQEAAKKAEKKRLKEVERLKLGASDAQRARAYINDVDFIYIPNTTSEDGAAFFSTATVMKGNLISELERMFEKRFKTQNENG